MDGIEEGQLGWVGLMFRLKGLYLFVCLYVHRCNVIYLCDKNECPFVREVSTYL